MEIELTRLFIKVIQHGGFSKAAAALRVPKSTISKAVSKLEAKTGTKLLIRTTRSQTLTAAGRVFYETCLGPIQILEDAQKSLFGQDNIISGKIKLTAPEDLGNLIITPVIGRLCRKYPLLDFEMNFTNELIDLVKDGYDIAIRIGQLKESNLKQRKVGDIEMIPVASPSFLKSVGKITIPQDLENLDALILQTNSLNNQWILKNERKIAKLTLKPRIQGNQMSSLITGALSGAGIALVPGYLVAPLLVSGDLIRLFPDWCGTKLQVSIVSPMSMGDSSRLNIFTAELVSAFRDTLNNKN
jgi:DNA-binding transcriptional LysR family regulator